VSSELLFILLTPNFQLEAAGEGQFRRDLECALAAEVRLPNNLWKTEGHFAGDVGRFKARSWAPEPTLPAFQVLGGFRSRLNSAHPRYLCKRKTKRVNLASGAVGIMTSPSLVLKATWSTLGQENEFAVGFLTVTDVGC
jgi:hypothetical protein